MKKSVILASCLMLSMAVSVHAADKVYKIGLLMWQDNRDYDEAQSGFTSAMDASGLKYSLDLRRAHGDEKASRQILRELAGSKPDLILTFGSKSTLWAVQETKGIPIICCASAIDPVEAGIANSIERPGKGVTGSINRIRSEEKLAVFQRCVPQMKKLGVMYDPSNIISSSEVSGVRRACESAGIELAEASIKDANDVEGVSKELVGRGIDALWIATEPIAYKNTAKITKATRAARIPVVSSTMSGIGDEAGVRDAGMLAVTMDLWQVGRLCAPAAVEILTSGKDAGDIAFATPPSFVIAVNANAAAEIGYQIPHPLLSQANMVFKGFGGQKIVVAGTGDSQELLRAIGRRLTDRLGEGEVAVPESVGSSGGIKALLKGDADLARIARAMKQSEKDQGLTCRVFGMAPLAFVVHQDVTGVENITTEQIIGIYSGTITDWRELGGAQGKIYPVTRESGDAGLVVLQEKMPGFAAIQTPAALTFYTTPQALEGIAGHRGTIGFLSMPMVVNSKLKVLKVDGVFPSEANVLNGSYKFCVPLGLVYKGELQGLSKSFVDFVFSEEGTGIVARYGVVQPQRQLQ
jgi:phosphate transport system substrate-binding protein